MYPCGEGLIDSGSKYVDEIIPCIILRDMPINLTGPQVRPSLKVGNKKKADTTTLPDTHQNTYLN